MNADSFICVVAFYIYFAITATISSFSSLYCYILYSANSKIQVFIWKKH